VKKLIWRSFRDSSFETQMYPDIPAVAPRASWSSFFPRPILSAAKNQFVHIFQTERLPCNCPSNMLRVRVAEKLVFFSRSRPQQADIVDLALQERRILIGYPA
jgi:hypothetical protein